MAQKSHTANLLIILVLTSLPNLNLGQKLPPYWWEKSKVTKKPKIQNFTFLQKSTKKAKNNQKD